MKCARTVSVFSSVSVLADLQTPILRFSLTHSITSYSSLDSSGTCIELGAYEIGSIADYTVIIWWAVESFWGFCIKT